MSGGHMILCYNYMAFLCLIFTYATDNIWLLDLEPENTKETFQPVYVICT